MRIIQFIQWLSFLSLLVCGSGESWSNLIAVCISLAVFCLTTLKLNHYGMR